MAKAQAYQLIKPVSTSADSSADTSRPVLSLWLSADSTQELRKSLETLAEAYVNMAEIPDNETETEEDAALPLQLIAPLELINNEVTIVANRPDWQLYGLISNSYLTEQLQSKKPSEVASMIGQWAKQYSEVPLIFQIGLSGAGGQELENEKELNLLIDQLMTIRLAHKAIGKEPEVHYSLDFNYHLPRPGSQQELYAAAQNHRNRFPLELLLNQVSPGLESSWLKLKNDKAMLAQLTADHWHTPNTVQLRLTADALTEWLPDNQRQTLPIDSLNESWLEPYKSLAPELELLVPVEE